MGCLPAHYHRVSGCRNNNMWPQAFKHKANKLLAVANKIIPKNM